MRLKQLYKSHKKGLNFFQLASLPAASLSLPVILMSEQLIKDYGIGITITSILIGNLLLWLVAVATISMVQTTHMNAIENIKGYFGRYGGTLIAVILMLAFLTRYAMQLNLSMAELDQFFQFDTKLSKDIYLRIGAFLGLIAGMLSIGGIRLFKTITSLCLPVFMCLCLYGVFASDVPIEGVTSWEVSFSGVLSTISLLLPGFINFPTIFKYSRSRAHSFLGLTLVVLFISFFEISAIWLKFTHPNMAMFSHLVLLTIFVVVASTCACLLNIFFASACWETIDERFNGPKGLAIIGLLGTLTYTFLQISSPVRFFEDLTNSYIACLGTMLLIAYLMRLLVKHRPRTFEKVFNMSAWIIGCVVATVYESKHFLKGTEALLAGVSASILFFMVVIFIEETVWASCKKFSKDKTTKIKI